MFAESHQMPLDTMTNCHYIHAVRKKHQSLAEYFEKTGATQESLAVRLGVTRSYVSLLTSGERQPALDLALKIEALTGVPVASLVSQQEQAS